MRVIFRALPMSIFKRMQGRHQAAASEAPLNPHSLGMPCLIGQMRTLGAGLFHVRDGRVIRYVTYFDRERAFADLGLASDDSPNS
jgi:hypothetical protein